MNEFNNDLDTEDIIEDFPFNRHSDQMAKLAKYFVCSAGMNKIDIQEETGISQPTIRKIQEQCMNLSEKKRAYLVKNMAEFYIRNIL